MTVAAGYALKQSKWRSMKWTQTNGKGMKKYP